MASSLRVRTRQSFGFGATGAAYQHCYELAHMTRESEADDDEVSSSWIGDLEEVFHQNMTEPVHLVEKLNLHFSDQFCYRFSWPETPGS